METISSIHIMSRTKPLILTPTVVITLPSRFQRFRRNMCALSDYFTMRTFVINNRDMFIQSLLAHVQTASDAQLFVNWIPTNLNNMNCIDYLITDTNSTCIVILFRKDGRRNENGLLLQNSSGHPFDPLSRWVGTRWFGDQEL